MLQMGNPECQQLAPNNAHPIASNEVQWKSLCLVDLAGLSQEKANKRSFLS